MARKQEWFTHPKPLEIVLEVFGGVITIDPFANVERTVPALVHYVGDEGQDGFELPWRPDVTFGEGHVTAFVNGPWKAMDQVVDRMLSQYQEGNINEAIMLAPSRTDRPWSQLLMREGFLRYEPDERYHYICRKTDKDGELILDQDTGKPILVTQTQIPGPSHLYYVGKNTAKFIAACREGVLVRGLF